MNTVKRLDQILEQLEKAEEPRHQNMLRKAFIENYFLIFTRKGNHNKKYFAIANKFAGGPVENTYEN